MNVFSRVFSSFLVISGHFLSILVKSVRGEHQICEDEKRRVSRVFSSVTYARLGSYLQVCQDVVPYACCF